MWNVPLKSAPATVETLPHAAAGIGSRLRLRQVWACMTHTDTLQHTFSCDLSSLTSCSRHPHPSLSCSRHPHPSLSSTLHSSPSPLTPHSHPPFTSHPHPSLSCSRHPHPSPSPTLHSSPSPFTPHPTHSHSLSSASSLI